MFHSNNDHFLLIGICTIALIKTASNILVLIRTFQFFSWQMYKVHRIAWNQPVFQFWMYKMLQTFCRAIYGQCFYEYHKWPQENSINLFWIYFSEIKLNENNKKKKQTSTIIKLKIANTHTNAWAHVRTVFCHISMLFGKSLCLATIYGESRIACARLFVWISFPFTTETNNKCQKYSIAEQRSRANKNQNENK